MRLMNVDFPTFGMPTTIARMTLTTPFSRMRFTFSDAAFSISSTAAFRFAEFVATNSIALMPSAR